MGTKLDYWIKTFSRKGSGVNKVGNLGIRVSLCKIRIDL